MHRRPVGKVRSVDQESSGWEWGCHWNIALLRALLTCSSWAHYIGNTAVCPPFPQRSGKAWPWWVMCPMCGLYGHLLFNQKGRCLGPVAAPPSTLTAHNRLNR